MDQTDLVISCGFLHVFPENLGFRFINPDFFFDRLARETGRIGTGVDDEHIKLYKPVTGFRQCGQVRHLRSWDEG